MIETDIAGEPGDAGAPVVNTTGQVIGVLMALSSTGAGRPAASLAVPANTAVRVATQLVAGDAVTHPYLGVSVDNADGGGARVRGVAADGPAAGADLRAGDLIVGIGERRIGDADDVVAAVQASRVGSALTVVYVRDGSEHRTTVTVGPAR